MNRFVPILAVSLASLVIAGCIPSAVNMLEKPTNDTELQSVNGGLVLVQVADTTPVGAAYPVNQVTLAPKDVNESDEIKYQRMTAIEAPGNSTKFFYAVLPANDYSISGLRVFYSFGDSYLSLEYPAGIELGTFTVEPGKITDLGVLAVYVKRRGEDYLYDTVRTSSASRTLGLLEKDAPRLLERTVNSDSPMSWHDDGKDVERQYAYREAVNRQIVFGQPYVEEATGEINYPSRLGTLVQRSADGDWLLEATEEDAEISLLTRVQGRQVMVNEFSEIFVRDGRNEAWEAVQKVPAESSLMYIDEHPVLGVYAVTQEAQGITIWSSPGLDSEWTRVHSFEPELGFFASLDQSLLGIEQNISGAVYVSTDDYLFMVLRGDLYRYDFATDTVTELKTPNVTSLQARNGVITISSYGTTRSNKASFDSGESWQSYSGPIDDGVEPTNWKARQRKEARERPVKLIGHPIFFGDQSGFAVHEGDNKEVDPFLLRTDDGGSTWVRVESDGLPEDCASLEFATTSEILLGCFVTGEFYRSTDQGVTWELEREVSET